MAIILKVHKGIGDYMDRSIKYRIVVILLIFCLLLSGSLYRKSLHFRNELGRDYYFALQIMDHNVHWIIHDIEDNVDPSIIKVQLNNLYLLDTIFSNSTVTNLYFSDFFYPKIDLTQLENDFDYREEIINELKAYHNVLTYILDDIDIYKKNHRITKFRHLEKMFTSSDSISSLLRLSDDIIYYDYFSRQTSDIRKYTSKLHELIYTQIKD